MSIIRMDYYAIGGLGVDFRIFEKLKLKFPIKIIKWIAPLAKESIYEYAKRISTQIDDSRAFTIIAVSFGGMVCMELNKIIKPQRIILISSATTKKDLPLAARLVKRIGLGKVVPHFAFKPPTFIINWIFGAKDKESQQLLDQIIDDIEPHFLRWALREILCWENITVPGNILRIHGTADKLLPFRNHENQIVIERAGHFIIVNNSEEVSTLLNDIVALNY